MSVIFTCCYSLELFWLEFHFATAWASNDFHSRGVIMFLLCLYYTKVNYERNALCAMAAMQYLVKLQCVVKLGESSYCERFGGVLQRWATFIVKFKVSMFLQTRINGSKSCFNWLTLEIEFLLVFLQDSLSLYAFYCRSAHMLTSHNAFSCTNRSTHTHRHTNTHCFL